MRDEQYLTVGANPIMPALSGQALGAGEVKKDNVADVMARLNRVRDEKFVSPTSRTAEDTQEPGLSFSDLIDTINPLQHIPVVSSVYRAITDDEISPAARVAGDSLFLGPIGAVGALFDLGVEAITGNTLGEHAVALFGGEESEQVAADATATVTGEEALPQTGSAYANSFIGTGDIALSPTEAFFFTATTETTETSAISETLNPEPAPGYAGLSPEPVALESLPSDILAALYSGQAVGSNPQTAQGVQPGPTNLDKTEAHPRWNLLSDSGGDTPPKISEPLISSSMVARAYDPSPANDRNEPALLGYQGGWLPAMMPEAISRYQHSESLQRANQASFVDIRN